MMEKVFSEKKKNPIYDRPRSHQTPYTDQLLEFDPYMRTYFWVTI